MYETDFIQGCMSILGSLATIAIIVTGLGTVVGLVKPADALKYCIVIGGIVIVTALLVSVLVDLWSSMSQCQRIIIAAILFSVLRLWQLQRQPRKKSDGE